MKLRSMFNNNGYKFIIGLVATVAIAATIWFSEVSSAQKWQYKEDVLMAPTAATITGRVFQDFNGNGTFDNTGTSPNFAIDAGINGVTVSAYDPNGAARGTTTTVQCTGVNAPVTGCLSASDRGMYSLSATGTGPYRIEFTNLPSGYSPSARSTDSVTGGTTANSGSTTQFVNNVNTSNVNLAVNKPGDYSQNTPQLVTVANRYGTSAGSTNPSVVSFPYTNSGNTGTINTNAQVQNIGSAWGIAYKRTTKHLFVSANGKRHVGVGPQGLGGVYVLDYTSTPTGITHSFTLQGVVPANGGAAIDLGSITRSTTINTDNYLAPANSLNGSRDIDAFDKAGKTGFGDIDMGEDNTTLWLVNLNQRAIISMSTSGTVTSLPVAGTVNQYPIATLPGVPTCTGGTLRPWALAFRNGLGYLGAVCDAATSQSATNLRAYVLSFDPNNVSLGFTNVINFPLNFTREFNGGDPGNQRNWRPWAATWAQTGIAQTQANRAYPEPILADIEFEANGAINLGFVDRFGNQGGKGNLLPISGSNVLSGHFSAGDTVHVCNSSGTFILEGTAGCADSDNGSPTYGGSAQTNDGPSNVGEFFYQDGFSSADHAETATGALAHLKGSNELTTTSFDPTDTVHTQGINRYNPTNGTTARAGFLIYSSGTTENEMGKASGLGDLELLSDAAPLEIGNRVWRDANANGVQDPGELPIAGITVRLYQGSTLVGTAITDANGEYYFVFSSGVDPTPGDNIGQVNGGILYNTAYEVRFDNPADYASGGPLNNLLLTRLNETSQNGDDDSSDSDASTVGNPPGSPAGNFAVISLTTGGPGANNHTFDVGFASAPTAAGVSVEGRVMLQAGNGVRNAMVILTEADGTQHTALTGTFGYYRFDDIEVGQTVVVSVRSKRFVFNPPSRIVSLTDGIANLDFIAKY